MLHDFHIFRYAECLNEQESGLPNWEQVNSRELYDYSVDPWEGRNLVDDPEYSEVVQQLSEKLHAGWAAALPKVD